METTIRVREIMSRPVLTVDVDANVLEAAAKMISANIGSLVVVHEGKPMGIITERDLVKKVVAKAEDPRRLRVGDVMNSPLIKIHPDASLRDAAAIMLKSGVKRLPVISDDGKLVGIITDTDLVSGSSLGLNDILADLIEMHRESVHFQSLGRWSEAYASAAASSQTLWSLLMGRCSVGAVEISADDILCV